MTDAERTNLTALLRRIADGGDRREELLKRIASNDIRHYGVEWEKSIAPEDLARMHKEIRALVGIYEFTAGEPARVNGKPILVNGESLAAQGSAEDHSQRIHLRPVVGGYNVTQADELIGFLSTNALEHMAGSHGAHKRIPFYVVQERTALPADKPKGEDALAAQERADADAEN